MYLYLQKLYQQRRRRASDGITNPDRAGGGILERR
jgi:hypothetical protein